MDTRHVATTFALVLLAGATTATNTAFGEALPGSSDSVAAACPSSQGIAARVVDVAELRGVRGFDFAELRVEYARTSSVVIEGDAGLLPGVEVSIDDGILRLGRGACVTASSAIRVTVSGPSFEVIEARGAARVSSDRGFRSSADATIELSESAQADLEIRAGGEVVVFADGSGIHRFDITAKSLIALHSGTGDFSIAGQTESASLAEIGPGTIATKKSRRSPIAR